MGSHQIHKAEMTSSIVAYMYVHAYVCIYMYMYMCVCMYAHISVSYIYEIKSIKFSVRCIIK
jgi:hypothetical protein